jgi:glycosyltransferase involved in cell wall biosynthesis
MSSVRIVIVHDTPNAISETFIRAHIDRLPGTGTVFHSLHSFPAVTGLPVVPQGWWPRVRRGIANTVLRQDWAKQVENAWETAIRGADADVILAEYGTTGALIAAACERLHIPLVVHFHGFDATRVDVLDRTDRYRWMFPRAAAVVAVSRAMEYQLLNLGCPREKLVYNPYGIDCEKFKGAAPATAEPRFLAVGRMVEKKGPHLTIASFVPILRDRADARLCMIGDGPLLGVCRDLAAGLGIAHAVTFLGAQPHEAVVREMRRARALVQHSVTASDGDSEGTPVAVVEAGAMGVPVISTRHAGIADVVVEGITGLLVEERDVAGMTRHMMSLTQDPALAGELGGNAAAHIRRYYTMEQSIGRLFRILSASANHGTLDTVRASIEAELPAGLTTT